ncbi:hypothetical protein N0V84_001587 [Fusarium piperis]|uniref:Sm protein F n=1 Tax=Fusarium piperis TaxID=1435070 RepID=A0A9W8WLH1_9HYPO|nr:hypothetical protein N0V84_001587 [Fusarium piperis]
MKAHSPTSTSSLTLINTAKMSFAPLNPRPMLQDLVSRTVLVRLKWGEVEYKGTLVSVDSYMNLQLSGTEEYIADKPTGSLGQVLIRYNLTLFFGRDNGMLTEDHARCNNVLWVRGADEGKDPDAAMTG